MFFEGLSRGVSDASENEGPLSSECFDDGISIEAKNAVLQATVGSSEGIADILGRSGIRNVEARGRTVFLRTLPLEQRSWGGIWLSPKSVSFYDGPAHLKIIRGVVFASGPKCEVKPGDIVAFQRLNFARWHILGGDTYTGWIDETQLLWIEEFD